jgi:uncharacterized protein YbaA (DUF1428 family)
MLFVVLLMSKSNANGMETEQEHIQLFVWRTPKKNHDAMMQIYKQASSMHRKYGERLEFFQLGSTETSMEMEGITNIAKTVSANQDEEVWLELNFYRDRKHLDGVSAKMQRDESAGQLYKQFMDLISPGSCIEGGFSRLRV